MAVDTETFEDYGEQCADTDGMGQARLMAEQDAAAGYPAEGAFKGQCYTSHTLPQDVDRGWL